MRQNKASVPKHQLILPNRHIRLFLHKNGFGTGAKASAGTFGRNVPFLYFCPFPWPFDTHCPASVHLSLFHLASVHLSLSSQFGFGTEVNASAGAFGTPLSSHRRCLRFRQDTIEAGLRRFALSFAFPCSVTSVPKLGSRQATSALSFFVVESNHASVDSKFGYGVSN